MKHLLSKDLAIIFILSTVNIILLSFPSFDSYGYLLEISFLALSFLFVGYSLTSLIRPEETYKNILRKPVLILEFSVLLILIISLILKFSWLGLNLKILVMVLSVTSMILATGAFIRRINYHRSPHKPVEKPVETDVKNESLKVQESKLESHVEDSNPRRIDDVQIKMRPSGIAAHMDLIAVDLMCIFTLSTFYFKFLNVGLLHNILGDIFILFLSGYSIVAIIFPDRTSIGKIKLLLCFGLSLTVSSLIGFTLNFTKYGISMDTILVPLVILTLILTIYAHIRRIKVK